MKYEFHPEAEQERLATVPSADFCPIKFSVTAEHAAPVTLGSGGTSTAFALALYPAPLATTARLRFHHPAEARRSATKKDAG